MTTAEFAYICKHPEIIAAQFISPLEETAFKYPFCQSAHILSAKYYEDIDESSETAQLKLRKAALYCTDRAMLKTIMDRDPAQVIEERKAKQKISTGRSVKTKTSVIHREANPALSKVKKTAPVEVETTTLKPSYDHVRVPEIILPNEKLLANTEAVPFERKSQVLHLNKPNELKSSVYTPISVQQPYGEALFNELYKNLKELGQKKKKVLQILDRLPSKSPERAATVKKNPEIEETRAKTVTAETKGGKTSSPTTTSKATQTKPKPTISTENKKEVSNKVATKKVTTKTDAKTKQETKKKIESKAKSTVVKKESPVHGKEHTAPSDETELLLEYLNQLSHENEPLNEQLPEKKNETEKLEHQQNVIDSFLKELPTLNRESVQADTLEKGDLSEKSTQSPNMVSENLAKIYERQGNKAKAIDMYQKLMLKYPEKSSYFAAEIEKIENKS